MNAPANTQAVAQSPSGLNHLVLKVRDIVESHHFWTELLGFHHVGTSRRPRADGLPAMRFYSGKREGKLHHHDVALYQVAPQSNGSDDVSGSLDHVAVEYPSEQAWRDQIRFLTQQGVTLESPIERGTTYSIHVTDPNGIVIELLYELPRDHWESDIDGALNRGSSRPLSWASDDVIRT